MKKSLLSDMWKLILLQKTAMETLGQTLIFTFLGVSILSLVDNAVDEQPPLQLNSLYSVNFFSEYLFLYTLNLALVYE